jgi:hypothetical protein
MSKRTIGFIVILAGLILVILSITADMIGIGAEPGFGWKQTLGLIVGFLMVAGAGWWTIKKSRPDQ